MTDDIVTRLRREAIEEGFSATDWTQLSFDVQDVCDEIERLRNQVRQLEAERDQWQRQVMTNG